MHVCVRTLLLASRPHLNEFFCVLILTIRTQGLSSAEQKKKASLFGVGSKQFSNESDNMGRKTKKTQRPRLTLIWGVIKEETSFTSEFKYDNPGGHFQCIFILVG